MTCSFEGCDRPLSDKGGKADGLCTAHWMQKRRGGELKPLRPRRANGAEGVRKRDPRPTAMRQWLKENGYEVPARGRIPQHLQDVFFRDSV